jgi:EmrB/QacA subfamily drug resistance transporter
MDTPDTASIQQAHVPGAEPVPENQPGTATQRKIALFIAILAGFLTPFDVSSVNIALPAIGTQFHLNAISLSWIATAYLLASALFLVPFGKIADIYGRKKVFVYGLAIFAASSFAMTMVWSEVFLIGARVAQGLGASMIFGTTVAILTSIYPKNERGRVLGIYVTTVYLGLTAGPLLGGILVDTLGWQSIFFINVPLALLAGCLVIWKLEGEWADCRGEKFDLAGSVIYGIAIVAVMVGFSSLPGASGFALLAAGAIVTAAFILYEHRVEYPVLNVRLFAKNRVFVFSSLAALINYSATFGISFLLSLDLQYTKGFSAEHAGLILIAAPVIQMAVSPFAGRLSDRMEPRIIATMGMAFCSTGLFLLIFLNGTTPLGYIICCLLLLGFGFGLFSSPNINAIMSAVEKKYYGVAAGIMNTMRLLGQMLSMGIVMMIFSIVIGKVEISQEYHPGFIASLHYAFIVFTALCIIGTFASYVRKSTTC